MGARKMVKLKVSETSGVDHPAHLEEGWIVIKSKEPQMPNEAGDDTDFAAVLTQTQADLVAMTAERDAALAKNADLVKAQAPADDAEAFEKSMPEPVRALLKAARDETAEARNELRKANELRKDREFVAKASAWDNLPFSPEDIGPALRQLDDADPVLADTVIKALSSANAQAEAANIFAELGTGTRPDSGDAMARLTKMAKAAVEAGDAATPQQAISDLVAKHPDLYDAYRQEQDN